MHDLLHVHLYDLLQGFASGSLDDDAFAPRFFVDQGLEVMVSQSYSKNLGEPLCKVGHGLPVHRRHDDTASCK